MRFCAARQFPLPRSVTRVAGISSRMDEIRVRIAEQVKVDVLSKTQVEDNEARRKCVARNFVSDTITVPTKEMQLCGTMASLGDDVYAEQSTNALEAHIARLTGKEAGLFLPSGTMSNQVALRAHLRQPPYSVLFDKRSHICLYESSGTAFHSGAAQIAVMPENGHHLTLADVEANVVQGDDVHFAPTEVIALENTLNGTIFPQDEIVSIQKFAYSQGMKMHLDGARIWHVAAETGTSLEELCDPFDSISLCFSKGLGAPIGSCLVGSATFIHRARWLRKLLGGGMRQTGFLAACAAYALTHNFSLLPGVHARARRLEKGLEKIGIDVTSRVETCMVLFDPSSVGLDYLEIQNRASGLRDPIVVDGSRLVVHIQTTEEAVNDLLVLLRDMVEEKKKDGWVKPETMNARVRPRAKAY